MKKFAFTLQTVYDYKLTVEKTQKADLARANTILRELQEALSALEESFRRNSEARDDELARGECDVRRLEEYDAFFRRVHEDREDLKTKILAAEKERDRCRDLLIATMKELKAYVKLRDKQYEQYLKDVAAEEEKALGDIVSFSVVSDNK